MKIYSWLRDQKIQGLNAAMDTTIGDYWETAKDIIDKNDLQRKKVSARGKTYRLLQRDLLDGCIMPPIILAVTEEVCERYRELIARALADGPDQCGDELETVVAKAFEEKELIILDGLQRTYTVRDCISDAEDKGLLDKLLDRPVRLEVYVGLSKSGILYRMLTLNTGQTPMSFRHQIEILYHDYLKPDSLPNGIEVLREKEHRRARGGSKYKFNDVVDMFYAYSTGKPQSMDRQTLVSEIAEINFLKDYEPGNQEDLSDLLVLYNSFVRKLEELSDEWGFSNERVEGVSRPFGKSVQAIFERTQPMTAFGAEVKRLIKREKIDGLDDMYDVIESIDVSDNPDDSFDSLVKVLDEIAKNATKIGTSQRDYFRSCFRALFSEEFDSYCDVSQCWLQGQELYNTMYGDIE